MLSAEQRAELEQTGLVRLDGVFSAADAARMCDRVWHVLARRHGIRRDAPATWPATQVTGFNASKRAGAFAALANARLVAAVNDLLGPDTWRRPQHWGVPLVSFPHKARHWILTGRQWHLDFPVRGDAHPLFAVRILAFLAPLEAGCGGTLVLTGSHLLIERLAAAGRLRGAHSADVREVLRQTHPWLRDLWSEDDGSDRVQRFMVHGSVIDGVPVRVAELTGAPGDVFLMHPWQFHAPSLNCGTHPRLMLSESLVRTSWAVANYRPRGSEPAQ